MKQLVKNYTFNQSAKTVTLTDYGTVKLERVQLIVDVTINAILYNFADSSVTAATVSGNVITLGSVGSAGASDKLMIIYDSATGDPTYDTPALPSNAAQEAGGNLAGIAGAISGGKMQTSEGNSAAILTAVGAIEASTGNIPTSPAKDGTDGTGITPPAGAAGIRGWLSGIYNAVIGTLVTKLTDGTNTANVVANDAGYNGQVVNNGMKVLTFSTITTGAQNLLANTDVRGYAYITVVLTSSGTGLAWNGQFAPNSGGTYITAQTWTRADQAGNNAGALTPNASALSGSPVVAPYFQLAISAMTGGTTSGYVILSTQPLPYHAISAVQSGTFSVNMIATPSSQSNSPLSAYFNAALSNSAQQVASGIHRVHTYHFYNPNASVCFVQFFNSLSAGVTLGTTAPFFSLAIPPGGVLDGEYVFPHNYGTGISVAATTTAAGSTAPGTALVANIGWI